MEERERGSNIIFLIIFRQLGRMSSEEEGKGTEILGKKIKFLNNGEWEEYQLLGNFIQPLNFDVSACIINFFKV